jgi:hypothetical protein
MKIGELKSTVEEVFSSIVVFCPNFPPMAQTNTAKKFEQLTNLVDAVLERMQTGHAKQWLRICLQEIQQSWKHYEQGDRKQGRYLIQRAEEHFKNAFSKKQTTARFVVGESGEAQDADTGFPA